MEDWNGGILEEWKNTGHADLLFVGLEILFLNVNSSKIMTRVSMCLDYKSVHANVVL